MKNAVSNKIIHYMYEDKGDRVVFLSITVNTSDHLCDNFVCFLFLYPWSPAVRLVSWPENCQDSDRFHFRRPVCLENLKDSGFDFSQSLGNGGYYSSRVIYVSFHIPPSLISVSSYPTSTYSFPCLFSSTLCLSGRWCAFILKASPVSLCIIALPWHFFPWLSSFFIRL